jgi:hypothetical protein
LLLGNQTPMRLDGQIALVEAEEGIAVIPSFGGCQCAATEAHACSEQAVI